MPESPVLILLWFVGSYGLGSVNAALLVTRLGGFPDPREAGSGNAGATNVYKQFGKIPGVIVLVLDLSRAVCLGWAASTWFPLPDWCLWVGVSLLFGNLFPIFHGFRGGKGVATS